MYWPLKATTPSQSEIFSVIVACLYVLAFHDQTPFQSEIFFSKLLLEVQYFLKYFFKAVIVPWSLLVCMYWPSKTSTPSQSEIFFSNIFFVACLYVLAFQDQTPSQIEIFSFIVACSYVLAFQGHNTLPK